MAGKQDSTSSRLAALWPLLPAPVQTLLLQACLGPVPTVGPAWREWCRLVGNPRKMILRDAWGLKSILPLLHHSLRKDKVPLSKDIQTLLRTALFREQLRSTTIRRLCLAVLRTLETNDIQAVLASDLAIAETAYASPHLRHCGGVRLLIDAGRIDRAVRAISGKNWKLLARSGPGPDAYALLAEESGLDLQMNSRVRFTPHNRDKAADLLARSREHLIDGTPVRLPCWADLLLLAMDQALVHGSWRRIDWVCDAVMLLQRPTEQDWQTFVEIVQANHLSWPVLAVLDYLERSFEAVIPPSVLDGLAQIPSQNQKACSQVAEFCARSAARSDLIQAFRQAPGVRRRLWVLSEGIRRPLGVIRRTLRNKFAESPRFDLKF